MKTVQQKMRRRAGIVGMMCLLAAALSSCVKDNNNDNYVSTPAAGLAVFDASPDAGSLDFYLDANRVNNSPFTYGNFLDYFAVYTGKRTAKFTTTGTSSVIKTDTMSFVANNYYTLYLANLGSKADYLLTRDTLVRPAASMASIRLVNVSSDAPALDLGIKAGAVLVSKKAYRTYSTFVTTPGNMPITLEVRQNGTGTVLATIPSVTLRTGGVYTVWVHGLVAGTGSSAITADIFNNTYY